METSLREDVEHVGHLADEHVVHVGLAGPSTPSYKSTRTRARKPILTGCNSQTGWLGMECDLGLPRYWANTQFILNRMGAVLVAPHPNILVAPRSAATVERWAITQVARGFRSKLPERCSEPIRWYTSKAPP